MKKLHEMFNFWSQEVKVQSHTMPKLDLETWWRGGIILDPFGKVGFLVMIYFGLVWPWPLTCWTQSLSVHDHDLALWTTCASWRQNWFTCFQNIVFTSLVTEKWMNGWMNGQVKNIILPPANLAWQGHNRVVGVCLTVYIVKFFSLWWYFVKIWCLECADLNTLPQFLKITLATC